MPHVRWHVLVEYAVTIWVIANDVVVGVLLHLVKAAVIVVANRQNGLDTAVNDLASRVGRWIDRLAVRVDRF